MLTADQQNVWDILADKKPKGDDFYDAIRYGMRTKIKLTPAQSQAVQDRIEEQRRKYRDFKRW
jgi:hypothetical protein